MAIPVMMAAAMLARIRAQMALVTNLVVIPRRLVRVMLRRMALNRGLTVMLVLVLVQMVMAPARA